MLSPPTGLAANGVETFVLNVPFRSQYDNSPYQNANCGPASLGMVLDAYGDDVPTARLRALGVRLQGASGYDVGISLDSLKAIAEQAGLRTEGLTTSGGQYRRWSFSDLIGEIRHGYPVITLVHYASLPGHAASDSRSDHYIVAVGVTSQGLVVNDPAYAGNGGYHQLLRPGQLLKAWADASIPSQAVAILPPTGKTGLQAPSTVAAEPAGVGLVASLTPSPTLARPRPKETPSLSPVAIRSPLPSAISHAGLPASAATGSDPSREVVYPPGLAPLLTYRGWTRTPRESVPSPTSASVASPTTLEVPAQRPVGDDPTGAALIVLVFGAATLGILKAPRGGRSHMPDRSDLAPERVRRGREGDPRSRHPGRWHAGPFSPEEVVDMYDLQRRPTAG